jgi:hypothetical protein
MTLDGYSKHHWALRSQGNLEADIVIAAQAYHLPALIFPARRLANGVRAPPGAPAIFEQRMITPFEPQPLCDFCHASEFFRESLREGLIFCCLCQREYKGVSSC